MILIPDETERLQFLETGLLCSETFKPSETIYEPYARHPI